MKKIIGFTLLLSVVVIWVASSVLIQIIFKDSDFFKPFFLTYFSTSMFSIYTISLYWKRESLGSDDTLSLKQTIKLSGKFCPLWFLANYLFNVSLGETTVSSSTILSSSSGVFTLLLSVFFLKESPDITKFLAVLTTFGGIVCIAVSDENQGQEGLFGDIFAIFGAIFYAVYSVMLKAKSYNADMVLLFGFIGAINIVLFFPGFFILHYSGAEVFEWPNGLTLGMLIINALIGTALSDLLWAFSVRLLNPALCTLGLSLTIPLSIIADTLFLGKPFYLIHALGALLAIFGFVVMSLFENKRTAYLLSNKYLCSKTKEDVEIAQLMENSSIKG